MARPCRIWPEEELARLRKAVESGVPLGDVRQRFGVSHHTLVAFIRDYEWTVPCAKGSRKRSLVLPGFRKHGDGPITDAKLYGNMAEHVNLLRRRGWAVFIERDGFRVGGKLLDSDALLEKAARERRLSQPTGAM